MNWYHEKINAGVSSQIVKWFKTLYLRKIKKFHENYQSASRIKGKCPTSLLKQDFDRKEGRKEERKEERKEGSKEVRK